MYQYKMYHNIYTNNRMETHEPFGIDHMYLQTTNGKVFGEIGCNNYLNRQIARDLLKEYPNHLRKSEDGLLDDDNSYDQIEVYNSMVDLCLNHDRGSFSGEDNICWDECWDDIISIYCDMKRKKSRL